MAKFLFFFYDIGIFLGDLYVYLFRFYSDKINKLYVGRQQIWADLEVFTVANEESIWIHCASLGEFEQGRPLIEMVKENHPQKRIILSFFSPSGYEIRKDYKGADLVIYLPSDRTKYLSKIFRLANPSVFIFVKYEFWWRLIEGLSKHKIKAILISGVFRQSDYFLHPIFSPFKKLLMNFDAIYVQDNQSSEVLDKHGFTNHFCVGDTRIDRVIQNKSQVKLEDRWLDLIKGKTVIVYGSVWITDMKIVQNVINTYPDFIHIIAPHNIEQININQITRLIGKPTDLYSATEWRTNILIINNIGILMSLYGLAKYVYIGGGFGAGIHNILEPAVFGVPVFFGPNHQKFSEAQALKSLGASYVIQSYEDVVNRISEMEATPFIYQKAAQNLSIYFDKNRGATEKIYTYIEPILKNPM